MGDSLTFAATQDGSAGIQRQACAVSLELSAIRRSRHFSSSPSNGLNIAATTQPVSPPSRRASSDAAAPKVERVAHYIDANFADALPLQDLCEAAHLSGSYLIRAFKKRYGVAPHEYQTNRRIQYAKARLRDGAPLAQVALDVGFADQAHFQRVFKRMTAATPGQYRD